jgi:hypothetical protein
MIQESIFTPLTVNTFYLGHQTSTLTQFSSPHLTIPCCFPSRAIALKFNSPFDRTLYSDRFHCMKLNLFRIATVAAVTLMATTTVAPAQAAAIAVGSTLNLSSPVTGGVRLSGNNLDFFGLPVLAANQGIAVDTGTGSFVNAPVLSPVLPVLPIFNPNRIPQISDLTLSGAGNVLSYTGPRLNNFIKNMEFGPLLSSSPLSFDLISFIYDQTLGQTTSLTGFFRSGADEIAATGLFTTQPGFPNPTYSLSLRAVPTPALLPGLIGFGVAALRKRKLAAGEEAKTDS